MLKESIQFFGLGQCGSRLGLEFSNFGYNVCYYNSDSMDVRGLEIDEEKLLLIQGTGTGRSTTKGKEILENHIIEFEEFLLNNMEHGKMQIFLVGLGGGTGGSSIIPAVEFAQKEGHKVGVIATLPTKAAGMLQMDNAMKTLRDLRNCNANMFILIDNDLLFNKVGLSDDWWKKINEFIVVRMVSVFGLLREGKISQKGIGSIDKAEIMRIIQYGNGMTDIRDVYFNSKETDTITEEDLKKKLFAPCFVEGYNYKDTLAYMVSIDLPPNGVFTNFSSKVFDITKQVCGSSISIVGMFIDPLLTNALRVTFVNNGLKLPKVLKSRIGNLKRDSDRYTTKKQKEDKMDLSQIEDISIDEDFDV